MKKIDKNILRYSSNNNIFTTTKKDNINIIPIKKNIKNKILHSIKNEYNTILSKFMRLIYDTLSLVVSFCLRDACKYSFKRIYIEGESIESSAWVLYSIIITILGIFLSIKLQLFSINSLKCVILILNDNIINDNLYIKFAIQRRFIKLSMNIIIFTMAWSWRDSLMEIIEGIIPNYNKESNTLISCWIFIIFITLFISLMNGMSNHFYCCFPRENIYQKIYMDSSQISFITKLMYDNFRFVNGIAWYESIIWTLYILHTNKYKELKLKIVVLGYWIITLLFIFINVIFTHLWHKYQIKNKIKKIEIKSEWILDVLGKESNYEIISGLNKQEIIQEISLCEKVFMSFKFEIIDNTIFGFGIAGFLCMADTIKYTIGLIYMQEYDIQNKTWQYLDKSLRVLYSWMAFSLTFIASIIIIIILDLYVIYVCILKLCV